MPAVLRRPAVAAAVLLAVYLLLSLANDARGYLGTDTGGKVATLRAMERHGGVDPDVGYWAERWDPAGRLHPLYYTAHIGDRWVNVTTLPALLAAYPLFRLAGYRGALLVPMLGSVLAALAARALARRLGGDERVQGWAFWLVGLASPLTIYALDFWEHSLGVALIAWAVVLLLDVARDARGSPAAAGAGVLLGAAATMRTESLVYAVVAVGCAGGWLLLRRRIAPAVVAGVAAVVGAAVPLALNVGLEQAVLGHSLRAERASGTVTGAIAGGSTGRVREGAVTFLNLRPSLDTADILLGLALAVLLVYVAVRAAGGSGADAGADRGPAVIALAGAVALYVTRAADGLGFVPGLVAATPIAAVGLARGWRTAPGRFVVAIAVLALPVVWRFQFTGGAPPQWAGRYILPSGLLLLAAGVTRLPDLVRWARVAFVVLSVVVTAFGVAWLSQRSHDIGRSGEVLAHRPEPVLVSRVAHLAREDGWFSGDRRWLTAVTRDDELAAAKVVQDAGFGELGVVRLVEGRRRPPDPLPGFRPVHRDQLEFLSGVDLEVVTYRAT